jgi:hypothetical protein
VPGLIGITGFHCRDDVHQIRKVAAARQHLPDNILFADVWLGDVLDIVRPASARQ